ncbi:MAG: hypothetical protein GY765_25740 [bacterium]|nr:hypothetical protein [bacterium]
MGKKGSERKGRAKKSQLNVPGQIINSVTALIRATQTHSLTADIDNFDGAFFLDIDISILGTPVEMYDNYASAIRSEYAHVPDDVYKRERIKLLHSFLNRDTVYETTPMNLLFGGQAIKNIREEIKRLQ